MKKTVEKSVTGKGAAKAVVKTSAASARQEKVPLDLVHEKARQVGLEFEEGASKENMIRAIQAAEGHQSCFGTPLVGTCGQNACCWRPECRG